MEEKLFKVSIDFLIRDQYAKYSIYIDLKGKKIPFRKNDSDNLDDIVRLKAKGVQYIYLEEKCYYSYLERRKREHGLLIDKEIVKKRDLIEELNKDEENLTLLLQEVGFEREKIQAIDNIKNKAYSLIENTEGFEEIADLLKNLKPTPMTKKNLEIYISTAMLKKLNFDNKKYLDKYIAAILIFDSLLTEEEFWNSYSDNKKEEHVFSHSIDILKKMPKDYFPTYIYSLIRDHHEKPDGTGYPRKITCKEINLFTAVYIIAEDYVQEFLKRGMKTNELEDIILYINDKYKPYINTNFEKALVSFNEIIGDKL